DSAFQSRPRRHRRTQGLHPRLRRHQRRPPVRDLVPLPPYLQPGVRVLPDGVRLRARLDLRRHRPRLHLRPAQALRPLGLLRRRRRLMAVRGAALATRPAARPRAAAALWYLAVALLTLLFVFPFLWTLF